MFQTGRENHHVKGSLLLGKIKSARTVKYPKEKHGNCFISEMLHNTLPLRVLLGAVTEDDFVISFAYFKTQQLI